MAYLSTTIKRWLLASGCARFGAALTAFGVAAQPTGLELFAAMIPVFNDDISTVKVNDGVGTAQRAITYTSTEAVHLIAGGQCAPGQKLTWGTYEQVIKERHDGTATAQVDVTLFLEPVREGLPQTYQFVYAVPDSGLTPATADLIRWGVPSQAIDPSTPDLLSGRQLDVISTDADHWETSWDLSRN